MKAWKVILSLLIVLYSSIAMAQAPDSIMIVPSDTLSEFTPMLARYERPAKYDTWLKRIAICEGLPLPPQVEIDKIQYVVVNAESFQADPSKQEYDASMLNRQHTMIVRLPSVWDYKVIGHEYLHFLLWWSFGNKYEQVGNTHPPQYFGKCNIRPN